MHAGYSGGLRLGIEQLEVVGCVGGFEGLLVFGFTGLEGGLD